MVIKQEVIATQNKKQSTCTYLEEVEPRQEVIYT